MPSLVYFCASSAVHSRRDVGLLMAKMMGRSLYSAIRRRISGVNSPRCPVRPIRMLGFTCLEEHTHLLQWHLARQHPRRALYGRLTHKRVTHKSRRCCPVRHYEPEELCRAGKAADELDPEQRCWAMGVQVRLLGSHGGLYVVKPQ